LKQRAIRLFTPFLTEGIEVFHLSPEPHHYLRRVMRVKPGEFITLFNEAVGEWQAHFADEHALKKGLLTLSHRENISESRNVRPRHALMLSLIRKTRLEWCMEKATELGVADIFLCHSDHSTFHHVSLERLHKILIEATEQSGRLAPPLLHAPQPIRSYESMLQNDNWWITVPGSRAVGLPSGESLGFVVGPEGGWSPEEKNWFEASGFQLMGLGPFILRSETAALKALSLTPWP
jgi:16S rRNA (uracil1498-N3)-methyltransferase